jgi:hypothetical protein
MRFYFFDIKISAITILKTVHLSHEKNTAKNRTRKRLGLPTSGIFMAAGLRQMWLVLLRAKLALKAGSDKNSDCPQQKPLPKLEPWLLLE